MQFQHLTFNLFLTTKHAIILVNSSSFILLVHGDVQMVLKLRIIEF